MEYFPPDCNIVGTFPDREVENCSIMFMSYVIVFLIGAWLNDPDTVSLVTESMPQFGHHGPAHRTFLGSALTAFDPEFDTIIIEGMAAWFDCGAIAKGFHAYWAANR